MPHPCLQRAATLSYLFIILSTTGCSLFQPLPQAELQTYRESLLETRRVGQQVLTVWDQAARTAKARAEFAQQRNSQTVALPFPASFNAREMLTTEQAPDAVSVRMLALDTVVRYTDLLVTLAEGKSVTQIQGSADRLIGSLKTVSGMLNMAPVPGLAAAGPLISNLLGLIEQARLRREFRDAVEQGEPAVAAILDFLIDDSSDYYTTVFALENEKRMLQRENISTAIGSIMAIVRDHARPTDRTLLPALNTRIVVVLGSMVPPRDPPPLRPRGSRAFSNLAQSQVMTEAQNMESANTKRKRIIEGMNAYHRLLTDYARLLNQTQTNLQGLSQALDRPMELQAAFRETLNLALRARRDIRVVRDALEATTTPGI